MTPPISDDPSLARCAGLPVTMCGLDEAVHRVIGLALAGDRGHDVHLCSADAVVSASRDPGLRALLCDASVNLPDGMAVMLASRLTNPRARVRAQRVPGTDLMLEVWREGQQAGLRHYLLGSTPQVLDAMQRRLADEFPRAVIAGVESPPFRQLGDADFAEQVERIRDSGAQIVWIGLGSPKQDWAAARLAAELPAVFVAVGAAFDFVAGSKPRAPRWMQSAGLEWLFRLLSEPRRLWRRYLLGLPRFAWVVIRAGASR